MPTTPNYGWEIPTEGGDPGIWDTTLNNLFDDIDAQVFENQEAVDDALDTLLAVPTVFWAQYAQCIFTSQITESRSNNTYGATRSLTAVTAGVIWCPLIALRPGTTLTTVIVRASISGGGVGSLKLMYQSRSGSAVQVGSTQNLSGSSFADYTFSALAHTVLENVGYFIQVDMNAGAFTFGATGTDVVVTV